MSLRVDFPATPNPGTSPADRTPQFLPAREHGQQIQTLTRHEHLAVSPSCSTGSTERAACPAPRAYPHVPGPSTGSCLPEAKLVGVRAARVRDPSPSRRWVTGACAKAFGFLGWFWPRL
jgi:hypothetical protein